MYLVYIDESGNTGMNLKDVQQPVFLLAALVLPESRWFQLEKEFFAIKEKYFGAEYAHEFEIHAKDLKNARGPFKALEFKEQLSFRDEILQLLMLNRITVVYRRIIKNKFERFCEQHYGRGIKINPYIMALPFVCMEVEHHIKSLKGDHQWMLIFDEQKENLDDAEKSLRTLRLDSQSILQTDRLIEKGFFVDSAKSFALQLTDLVAYYIRKYEEHKTGKKVSDYDKQTFDRIEQIGITGVGSKSQDILEWVKDNCL